MYNISAIDWSSIFHLIQGGALAYYFRRSVVWAFVFIVGYEILEITVLPKICCVNFWKEAPVNIFADTFIGFLGYFVGRKWFNYYEKFKQRYELKQTGVRNG